MTGLLADVNIEGLADYLAAAMTVEPWSIFAEHLQVQWVSFRQAGLTREAADSLVWQACQAQGLYLITDNRNRKGHDSLEATIRAHNTPNSLPVFTIADVPRLRQSREYAQRIIEKLVEYLLYEDNIRGTGRLYLP